MDHSVCDKSKTSRKYSLQTCYYLRHLEHYITCHVCVVSIELRQDSHNSRTSLGIEMAPLSYCFCYCCARMRLCPCGSGPLAGALYIPA